MRSTRAATNGTSRWRASQLCVTRNPEMTKKHLDAERAEVELRRGLPQRLVGPAAGQRVAVEQHDASAASEPDATGSCCRARARDRRAAGAAAGHARCLAFAAQLVGGVDVAKRVGLVVERDLDHRERRVPRVDLASARGRNAARCGSTSRRTSANTGCGWSNVCATASCASLRRERGREPRHEVHAEGTANRRAR